ncbi:hypothetical protein [Rheinheimera maricola]|uniref:Uncharacterized protein n=1 Tax=Rheinheimera maricola TaxID=2793282 RepID=A0ABS7XGN4_9GAMM|nr:hypothetical protein [Rheinheimera maricola]MBZ9613813.1 hypothetical protein [Rheinheimera maricola]
MLKVRTILVLLFIVLPAAQGMTLTLAFDTPGVVISQQERRSLMQRVATFNAAGVSVTETNEQASADLLLTTREPFAFWQFSDITVGYIPALIALSLQEYTPQSAVNIGQLTRDYMLADKGIHLIPEDSNVYSLLQAKRYDIIVESAAGIFQHDIKSQLYRRTLYAGRHIRLAMRTTALKAEFTADTNKADTNVKQREAAQPVTIQLIAKSFNPEEYLLQESAEDLAFFSSLHQHITTLTLKPVVTSVFDATEKLQQPEPACIVNFRKRADRVGLLYSLPTQVYLGSRLYIAKDNPLLTSLNVLSATEPSLSFQQLLKTIPDIKLASLETLQPNIMGNEQQSPATRHHFLPLTRFDTSVSLLQRGRVDALWLYPLMFRFGLDDVANANNFVSFTLAETIASLPVYLACNHSAETVQLIHSLNALLVDSRFQSSLLQQNSVGLNHADQQHYAADYRQAMATAVAQASNVKATH